jgi:hypothetical protein
MRSPAAIIQDIETALTPFVTADGGVIDVATDIAHAMQILATAPAKYRVVLVWDGYGSHKDARHGVASHRINTILHVNLGLAKSPGDKIYKTSIAGQPSFIWRMERLSQLMRSMRWPDGTGVDHAGLALQDSDWVQDTPANTTAHVFNWSLDQALESWPSLIVIPTLDLTPTETFERPIN